MSGVERGDPEAEARLSRFPPENRSIRTVFDTLIQYRSRVLPIIHLALPSGPHGGLAVAQKGTDPIQGAWREGPRPIETISEGRFVRDRTPGYLPQELPSHAGDFWSRVMTAATEHLLHAHTGWIRHLPQPGHASVWRPASPAFRLHTVDPLGTDPDAGFITSSPGRQ